MDFESFRIKINQRVNDRVFCNEKWQSLVWKVYYQPNILRPAVEISDSYQNYLKEFREKGIVVIPGAFSEIADVLDRDFCRDLDGDLTNDFRERVRRGERDDILGIRMFRLSFRTPLLFPFLFNPEMLGFLYNYYQRQPYYRNQPELVVTNSRLKGQTKQKEIAAKFHIDYYHQISVMLLINSLGLEDTCLEYAAGSHLSKENPWNRFSYSDDEVVKRYPIVKGIGPKGSLVIFDAGSGYHRVRPVENSERKLVQVNFTTGHIWPYEKKVDSGRDWNELEQSPRFVRKSVSRLLK